MAEEASLGPVSYLIVEFPGTKMTGDGLQELVNLTDQGLIRILDLVFVKRELDGTVEAIEITDLDNDGELDLIAFE
jgi:hypothetical protein